MDTEDTSSVSAWSPSPPPQLSMAELHRLPPKRRAGRKKFQETRHPTYLGVRARAGGRRWVCEVREPRKQARIWLGTYPTPEMAARAHDVAAIALRGARGAALNFPDSPAALPRARTASPGDIRRAAALAAELYRPPPPPPSPPPSDVSGTEAAYVDEEAIFDMPGLVEDMARGMLLTPPATGRGVEPWGDGDGDDIGEEHGACTLWMD